MSAFEPTPLPRSLQILVLVVSLLSSVLSLLGSGCILYMAHRKLDQMLQRLLIGVSLSDIAMTMTVLIGSFLLPPDSGFAWTFGNFTTCTVMGVFFYIFLATSVSYNVYLSFYYLAIVRYGWRENKPVSGSMVMPKWEVVLHALTVLIPLGLGIAAGSIKAMGPHPFLAGCFLARSPHGCEEGTELECFFTNQVAFTALFVILMIYVTAGTFAAVLSTFMVYWTVRSKLSKTIRFNSVTSTSTNNDTTFHRRIQEVRRQSMLYSLTYLNSYVWMMISLMVTVFASSERMHAHRAAPGVYFLTLMVSVMFPLQGLLNFLVYTRQDVQRWRKAQPELYYFQILRRVLAGQATGPPTSSVKATTPVQLQQEPQPSP
ncbi:expressed unknown protein [Seminavis robusta]|uniref:G-protein coupled receptors family 1 profile domain-containing protein n=1 Tax=Seminavis robusta TaxID=568900 RepID=A0A9N8EYQ9_9STRA|nr:expressed unknown protein [Seminavis robusta]|eukprot:Sro2155_g316880.1 n/a (373) ;mRNA; f:10723-11841